VLLFFGVYFWACKSDSSQKNILVDTSSAVESYSSSRTKPRVYVVDARSKQKQMIVDAYLQNIAYYKELNVQNVDRIRFVGKDAPWKPAAERQYCIDAKQRKTTADGVEDVYYFANYCRSISVLFREADRVFKSYIEFKNCEEICNCSMENHIDTTPEGAGSCVQYCKDVTWEQLCTSDASLKQQCCL